MGDQDFSVNEFIDSKTNRNIGKILCNHCNCLILNVSKATYVQVEHELPVVKQRKSEIVAAENGTFLKEPIQHYWLVNDMLTFENIGFTHTIDNKKYLLCADCEIGPLGYQNQDNKDELFLACSRVLNKI
jgi:hypothetical protein